MLDKEDYLVLQKNNHFIANIFFNPLWVNESDRIKYEKIINPIMYKHKGLFNLLYQTWGNYITLHGQFCKYEALSLT